jgi:NCS1 family nucleobase:cation symporter-1
MPDFTRYGRSQKEQMIGQVVALPTTMTLFAAMGVVITSASAQIFGEAIWNPVDLGAKLESRGLVLLAEFTVVVATLAMNIAANVVSPANDLANVSPGKISFRTGGLIPGIVAAWMMPWRLLADSDRYIGGWLLGYSGGLGSIAGVLIFDYWFIKRKTLVLADLYRRDGVYAYSGSGWNWRAIVATAAGCAIAWCGLFVPALHVLYDAAWFSGGFGSAFVYAWLMRGQGFTGKP